MPNSNEYPYDTIAYITDTINGQGWQGSGVLISPDEVLTASHVVYSSTGGAASDITVTPGYTAGSAPFGSALGTSVHYFSIEDPNQAITGQQSQFDYAVIHLSKPFTGLGTMTLNPTFSGGVANVSGYPASANGQLDSSQQSVTQDPTYSLLEGTALGPGSSGGPVWVTGGNGAVDVVGLTSSEAGGAGSTGYFTQITPTAYNQIAAWLAQDDSAGGSAPLTVLDTTTNQPLPTASAQYTGPVSGIQNQFINVTAASLNITTTTPNWFINAGSGTDAINVSQGAGNNVLDGGTGSNFLTGGTGDDTFYLDDRNPTMATFSTVDNFHSGDNVTVWGVNRSDFAMQTLNNQGASGYTGVDLVFTAPGHVTTSFVLTGYTGADLTNGTLTSSYGTTPDTAGLPGSQYLTIHAT